MANAGERPATTTGLNVSATEFKPTAFAPCAQTSTFDSHDAGAVGDLAGLTLSGADAAAGWQSYDDGYAYQADEHDDAAAYYVDDEYGHQGGYAGTSCGVYGGAEALLAVLREQFPQYSTGALADLLKQSGNDLNATVELLFSLENELSGQLHATTMNGHAFASSHEAPPSTSISMTSGKHSAGQAQLSLEDDFPSLTGSEAASSKPASQREAVVAASFLGSYAGKAKAAARLQTPASGAKDGIHWSNASRPSAPASTSGSAWSSASGTMTAAAAAAAAAAPVWQSAPGSIHRFATGQSAAAEYADARATARDLARLRNACFQQATQAYLSGNKALAKQLGQRGREYNQQMHEAHAVASEEIFSRRNAAASTTAGLTGPAAKSKFGGSLQGAGSSGTPTIDLHGLHVSEARKKLEETIVGLQKSGLEKMRVVVGVGTHGKVPSRLPNAVKSLLTEWGMRYREPFAGLLEVSLK